MPCQQAAAPHAGSQPCFQKAYSSLRGKRVRLQTACRQATCSQWYRQNQGWQTADSRLCGQAYAPDGCLQTSLPADVHHSDPQQQQQQQQQQAAP